MKSEDRIYLTDLRDKIQASTDMTEYQVGYFLGSLFNQIGKALESNQSVKISGLGTFKVHWCEPRKSVDVTTGESIMLDGYNKVVFMPESGLKEAVNAPFAVKKQEEPAATESVDPLVRLGEQAQEINSIIQEINSLPNTLEIPEIQETPEASDIQETTETPEVQETTETPDIQETPETPEVQETPETSEIQETQETSEIQEIPEISETSGVQETPETPETTETSEIQETPYTIEIPEVQETPEIPEIQEKPKKSRGWLAAGIILIILCALLVVGYIFFRQQIVDFAQKLIKERQTETIIPEDSIYTDSIDITEDETPFDSIPEVQEDSIEAPVPEARVYENFIITITLNKGSRLANLARKFYGEPEYWVYIYEANKDVLDDPNVIKNGTRIKIPDLPPKLIEGEEALGQARELEKEILGR